MIAKSKQNLWTHPQGHTRRGFSFAEVMFAVVILGIGFIMVAAVFPVAIRQTQNTGEENTAATAARTAATAIAQMPTITTNVLYRMNQVAPVAAPVPGYISQQYISVFPPTVKNYVLGMGTGLLPGQSVVAPPAVVVPFTGMRWNLIQANIIQNTDPRFSYVPFYRRESNSSVAELIMIAVANRNRPVYDSTDSNGIYYPSMAVSTARQPLNLGAYPLPNPTNTLICPDTITVTNPPTGLAQLEGCTIDVQNNVAGYPVIRTYTLGRPLSATTPPTVFELNGPDGLALAAGFKGWGTDASTGTTDPTTTIDPNMPTTFNGLVLSTTCRLNTPATLQAVPAYVQELSSTAANPAGRIALDLGPIDQTSPPGAAPGAFVIVSDDCPFDPTGTKSATDPTPFPLPVNNVNYHVGSMNGRIFRLGQPVVQAVDPLSGQTVAMKPGTFLLDPAYGMQPAPAGSTQSPDVYPNTNMPGVAPQPTPRMKVYIVGAGKTPGTTGNGGAAQDIGVFATYFQVQ